jgi:hypothetical protein
MDTSLRAYFLFEVFRINGHLKRKEPRLSVAVLGFKSLVLISNTVTVICMEGSDGVLFANAVAARGGLRWTLDL